MEQVVEAYRSVTAAERAGAAVLLTVDKAFVKIATDKSLSRVKVVNPLTFAGG